MKQPSNSLVVPGSGSAIDRGPRAGAMTGFDLVQPVVLPPWLADKVSFDIENEKPPTPTPVVDEDGRVVMEVPYRWFPVLKNDKVPEAEEAVARLRAQLDA